MSLRVAICFLPQSSLCTRKKKNRQGCAKAAGLHVKSGQEIPEGLEEELPKKNKKIEKARNGGNEPKAKKKKDGKQSSSNSIRMKKKNIKMFFSSSSRHEADGW